MQVCPALQLTMTILGDIFTTVLATSTFQASATPSKYGTDLSCLDDCDAVFSEVDGDTPRAVAEHTWRVVTSPRGSIPGSPDTGRSLLEMLRRGASKAEVMTWPAIFKGEIMRADDRVADVRVTFAAGLGGRYDVEIRGETDDNEPFALTGELLPDGALLKEILA